MLKPVATKFTDRRLLLTFVPQAVRLPLPQGTRCFRLYGQIFLKMVVLDLGTSYGKSWINHHKNGFSICSYLIIGGSSGVLGVHAL